MVNQKGQGTSEFVVVLAILTGLGIFIMTKFVGLHNDKTGTLYQIQKHDNPKSVVAQIASPQN